MLQVLAGIEVLFAWFNEKVFINQFAYLRDLTLDSLSSTCKVKFILL